MRVWACLLVAATACGEASEPRLDGLQIAIPWLLSHDSPPPAGMWAKLHIAGGFVCDLNVDPAGAASGPCPDVVTGKLRPLAVEYGVPLTGGVGLADFGIVAYATGKVDLTHEALSGQGESPEIDVSISPDAVYRDQDDIEAMRPTGGDCFNRDRASETEWLWCYNQDRPNTSLDCDGDLDSNMLEALGGTLSCPE